MLFCAAVVVLHIVAEQGFEPRLLCSTGRFASRVAEKSSDKTCRSGYVLVYASTQSPPRTIILFDDYVVFACYVLTLQAHKG